jgi:multimeric flavodoxin WrbA
MAANGKGTIVRKGQGDWPLPRPEFERRMRRRFAYEDYRERDAEIDGLIATAWAHYMSSDKSVAVRKAGAGHADPDYELSVEWLEARREVQQAAARQSDPRASSRILLICASARNDATCPGEMSKTYRLVRMARDVFDRHACECDLLDLSALVSEYGKVIYPCKGCVSTAMPLCHWPCSCYPNHSLGQVGDWMNEIYPRWAAAHGVMIVTPVYWYQAPSPLKLMMDRLVCADGGNPDPTTTHGKDAKRAKQIELDGWKYPRHLAGRAFSVVVHGDAAGADTLRRSLVDWLQDMYLVPAGRAATFDRYVGYYEPYATSHEALDRDEALHQEVRNAAHALVNQVGLARQGARREPDDGLSDPRPK